MALGIALTVVEFLREFEAGKYPPSVCIYHNRHDNGGEFEVYLSKIIYQSAPFSDYAYGYTMKFGERKFFRARIYYQGDVAHFKLNTSLVSMIPNMKIDVTSYVDPDPECEQDEN